jgi:hypothetical protein
VLCTLNLTPFQPLPGRSLLLCILTKTAPAFSAFGSYLLDGGSFGWVYAHKQGANGVITPYNTDNGTGIINKMQVNNAPCGTESATVVVMHFNCFITQCMAHR